jgi:hypothetical protein
MNRDSEDRPQSQERFHIQAVMFSMDLEALHKLIRRLIPEASQELYEFGASSEDTSDAQKIKFLAKALRVLPTLSGKLLSDQDNLIEAGSSEIRERERREKEGNQ